MMGNQAYVYVPATLKRRPPELTSPTRNGAETYTAEAVSGRIYIAIFTAEYLDRALWGIDPPP